MRASPRDPYCKSPIKWAGGKAQLEVPILKHIKKAMSRGVDIYHEPFVGGGAIFFALASRRPRPFGRAILSDTNAELINMYCALRDDLPGVVRELRRLREKLGLTEGAYYEVRASRPKSSVNRAARMIYLNKTCFNGLYRVNKKGEFNVPYGHRKNPNLVDLPVLQSVSAALQGVELLVGTFDWHALLGRAEPPSDRDFFYFDPPYLPTSKSADFTAYQAEGFTRVGHELLAHIAGALQKQGAQVLISNSDTPITRKIFSGFRMRKVLARRNINSVGSGRGVVTELLFSNKESKAT